MDNNDPKQVKKIRNYTIHVDRSLCIGASTCVVLAPKAFVLDSEAKSILLDSSDQESDETLLNASKGCPVMAITIIDNETGKQVFP